MRDVFEQLSRRISEAEHRRDLGLILREMHRCARKGSLSTDEFNTLATEEARRRMAFNEEARRG